MICTVPSAVPDGGGALPDLLPVCRRRDPRGDAVRRAARQQHRARSRARARRQARRRPHGLPRRSGVAQSAAAHPTQLMHY